MVRKKSKFLNLSDVMHNYADYNWSLVSVTSNEFYPIFRVNGVNMDVIYCTESVAGHRLFVSVDYSGEYNYYDYIISTKEVARFFGVTDVKTLFNKVKEIV